MDLTAKPDVNVRRLLIAALIFIILIGMNQAAYLINMIVISIILAMIGTPLFYFFKRRGFSDISSVAAIMVIYGITVLAFIFLIFESVNMLAANLPKYQELFSYRLYDLMEILKPFGISADTAYNFAPDWSTISKITIQVAGGVSSLIMDCFFIVVITCFMLLEIPALPGRMKILSDGDDRLINEYQEMCSSMIGWIVAKTKTNIVLGGSFGAMLFAFGIDFALFWGVLAIILSYIPYIGLLIVAVPAVILAWLLHGITGALLVIAGICIINAVVENIVFSKFAEKEMNMPPLVVILSLVLWTWVLGPVGMLISVPLTIMILIAFRYIESTKWILVLLGMDKENPGKNDRIKSTRPLS